MSKGLRRYIDDDSGIALFTVLGIIVLMTIAVMSAYFLAQQANLESARLRQTQAAFQAANAGVDIALARIQAHGYIESEFPISAEVTETGATYETSVTPESGSSFLCVSRGTDRNGEVETIRVKFFYFSLWNMQIANAGGVSNPSGGAVVGNTSVFGPLYCRGTVNLSGDAEIEIGPLLVNQGSITLQGNGSVGSPSVNSPDDFGPLDVYVTGAYPPIGSGNFYTTSVSNSVPNISLPLINASELNSRFIDAKNQSADNKRGDGFPLDPVNSECATTGVGNTYRTVSPPNVVGTWQRAYAPKTEPTGFFYKVVGAGTTPVPGVPSTSTLVIDGSTSWGTWPGDGHTAANEPGDDWAFDASTGRLYVWGTVYVDAPIRFTTDVFYVGNGTICANGNISSTARFVPDTAATATQTANQMDKTHSVGLVTPYDITFELIGGAVKQDPYDVPDVCGAFFCGGSFIISGHPLLKGSILANTIDFVNANSAKLVTDPRLPEFLPAGMPAAGQSLLYKGAWTRQ